MNVGIMVENEAALEWELQNAADPCEEALKKAAIELRLCSEGINKTEDCLVEAIEELKGTPMEDRIASLLNDLEDVHSEIIALANKYGKGVRE